MAAVSFCLTGADIAPSTGPHYALEPDAAVLVAASGQAFVLDLADRFYAIPPIGADMLRLALLDGEAAALADVVSRYDVERTVASADLHRLLDDLRRRGVLRRRDDPPRPPPRARGAALIAGGVRWLLRSPRAIAARTGIVLGLARLSFVLFGWRATLAAWRRAMAAGQATTSAARPDASLVPIDAAVRRAAARSPWGATCKERALVAWALSCRAGVSATLIVGVVQHPLGAHAWCETADAHILGDDAANCRRYLPVFRYA
jgi:hypothetical protein